MSALTGNRTLSSTGSQMTGSMIPKGYKQGQLQQFTPEQMQLFQRLFSQISPDSYLSRLAGGDQESFAQMEAPAMRQFQDVLGGISSRFSGMGSGARKSSGFQNTVSTAASNFAQDLAARRHDLQRQALMDLMGISESLLSQRPYEKFLIEKQQKPSFMQQLLGAGLPAAGAIAGGIFGGMPGAKLGATVGGSMGRAFF